MVVKEDWALSVESKFTSSVPAGAWLDTLKEFVVWKGERYGGLT